ncbi:BC1872 family protein [Lederbergia lenta]|uniref:BC1872 family protein n=1 Tax=Lederbergia lenta TaxID=1467 RepID=UPI002041810B|nr:hypothetical protein [Lederbergia lenta]MCM3110660.1 hypothetical protein [Lederbergia lenta]
MNYKEIDRLIAEKVMGWKYFSPLDEVWTEDGSLSLKKGEWKPSTNIQDAWIVLEKVCKKHNWRAVIDRNQVETEVRFKTQMGSCSQNLGHAENPSLAICYACLESVGVEV